MGNPDLKRIQAQEGAYTFTEHNAAKMFKEIDARLNGANVFTTILRTLSLIDTISYFSDVGRTKLTMELHIGYTVDTLPDTFTYIFFNADGSEDSRVTETATRDIALYITSCDSVFLTSESTKL